MSENTYRRDSPSFHIATIHSLNSHVIPLNHILKLFRPKVEPPNVYDELEKCNKKTPKNISKLKMNQKPYYVD